MENEMKHKYETKIDGETVHLHTPTPTGAELLAKVDRWPCRFELIAEYHEHKNLVIEPNETVNIDNPKLKGFITAEKEVVTITLNDKPYSIDRGTHTVAQILGLIGQTPDAYILYEEKDGPPMPLPADAKIHIYGCEIFSSQPDRGKSS